eukprot:473292-Pelagomonas_calceolata.AAC.1
MQFKSIASNAFKRHPSTHSSIHPSILVGASCVHPASVTCGSSERHFFWNLEQHMWQEKNKIKAKEESKVGAASS